MNSFEKGFIKRASEYGFNQFEAEQLIKKAVGMFPPAPPAGIEQMGAGMQQASRMPLSSPISPAMQDYATKPMEPAGMPQYPQPAAPAPAPAPVDPMINFKKYHATSFDPNSRMDRFKMQQLQQAQQGGQSLVRAANVPYHGQRV